MPRAHTPEERARIVARLFQRGKARLLRQGLAKTTISELARDAGIGKGSFYAFFESKEALFLAIQEREEAGFRDTLGRDLERSTCGREAIRTLMLSPAVRLPEHPFLRMLSDPDVLAELTLRIPAEVLAEHRARDRRLFTALFEGWRTRGWLRPDAEPGQLMDVLESMFLLAIQSTWRDPKAARRSAETIADAVAHRWGHA